jgi:hypothetical protein
MSAYSPDAMRACYDRIKAAVPSAQLGGIYANKPGYHNCRNQLPSSDYSVQKSYDQKGDGWAAGALDITLQPNEMKKFTQRLIDETKARGDTGKLKCLREFFGTVNGTTVTGMDVPGQYWVSSDDSHLWHIHCSGKREYANDKAAWNNVADVILGTSTPPKDDDMPKQIYLYTKSGQTTKMGKAGTWVTVGWDADLANTGGSSLSLPKGAAFFSMSAWLYLGNLPNDYNMYWRIQTLDGGANNVELAKFPIGEIRGTTGDSDIQFSQVGSVSTGKQTNLRILVASTKDDTVVKQAWWRCLYW